jgi:arsenate reductase
VATLRAIGIEIEETHKGAERGKEGLVNPIYHVRWGTAGAEPPLEIAEFSKRYDDPWNPADRFAALMVCSEADASCPAVKGASTRISMPYLDPKQYDGTEDEVRQYAELRDDIGRMLLGVMLQARWQLSQTGRRPAS